MKKKLLFLFSFLLCLTFISACGAEKSSIEPLPSDENVESSGNVSLKIWGAGEDAELLQAIIEKFKANNAGINFDFTVEAVAESDCRDTLLQDLSNAPDVFTFADDQFATFCSAGVLKPIPNGDEVANRNVSGAVDACKINNTMYAYPLTADNGYFLFYNKKYLSESDVASFDALLAKAEELEKNVTFDMSSGWYSYAFFGNTGLEIGLNDDGRTNFCNWNSTENEIKGIDIAKEMMNLASSPSFICGGDGDLSEGAKNDTVIAGVSGVWMSSDLQSSWGNNIGATKLPTYTCNGKQVQLASYAGYKLVGVNSYSANVDWAHKFADFLSSEECQNLRFQMRQQGPSNINSGNAPEVKQNAGIAAVIAQSEYASLQRIGNAYWGPMGEFGVNMANQNPSGTDLQDIMDKLVASITASN